MNMLNINDELALEERKVALEFSSEPRPGC